MIQKNLLLHICHQKKTSNFLINTSKYTFKNSKGYFHTSKFQYKLVQFNLADIGEGIKEVEVLKWYVSEGQQIQQFDKVAEVQSDKATVEITSRFDGVIKKLYHKTGDIAQVGRPLVDIETSSDVKEEPKKVETKNETKISQTNSCSVKKEEYKVSEKVKTTPSVRRIAREQNLDLTKVLATGKDGRILKQDVLSYVEGGKEVEKTVEERQVIKGDREEPIRGLMRTMIKSMELAMQVPHLGYCDDVFMDKLMQFRSEMNSIYEKKYGKISFLPFFIKAASLSMNHFPIINSQLSSDKSKIIYKGSHNIGIAMDTKNGLLVPNIKNVQDKSVIEIAIELNRLTSLGAEGKLGEQDLKGGTFTISNIGTIGGTYASPILVVPEVAILALGKTRKVPLFNDKNEVVGKHLLNASFSADHRVIDGATIARFSNLMKHYLENPLTIVTEINSSK